MFLTAKVLYMLTAAAAATAVGKRVALKHAAQMEPVPQYSQLDPVYHSTNHSTPHRRTYSPYPDQYYHPYSYPEPIIEIIIKESNQTLPPPTTPHPRRPTKEPIHVFYVKYKKNPNPKGEHDKIIYEKPVAALTTHQGEETNEQQERHEVPSSDSVHWNTPTTTTLRTIIHPESETFHSSGNIHVTFGSSDLEHHEQKEGSEQRPQVALPDTRISFTDRFAPPTTQQILSYQQQKQFLYEQSLRQQQQVPTLPLTPANTPRQFQQPNKSRLSPYQISFQKQQQARQQLQQFRIEQRPPTTFHTPPEINRVPQLVSPSPLPSQHYPLNLNISRQTDRPKPFINLSHRPHESRVQDFSNYPTRGPNQPFSASFSLSRPANSQQNNPVVQTFPDGEIVKSISQSEEHQIEHNFASHHHYLQPQAIREVSITPPPIHYPVYSSTTVNNKVKESQPTESPFISSTVSAESSKVTEAPKAEANKTVSTNLAALPDEVPADLRQQLLSSGILSNADISVLDYDKVGDIPIEQLPPEALEQLYGAGSEPVASVASAPHPVQMKVVRYDPRTDHGQALASSYIRPGATTLHPVILNDNKYNRYLPLKVNGTEFPVPEVGQLAGRIIKSVVVLAPVEYDGTTTGDDRLGRAVQIEAIRAGAAPPLRALVKHPKRDNFIDWLRHEKNLPPHHQSVVLLVAESPEGSEIFMYDINSDHVSRLRGELSRTFVKVAESNSSSKDLDGLEPSN